MVSRMEKNKNKAVHEQHIDSRFAIGFLSFFALLVSVYVLGNCRYLNLLSLEDRDFPAASTVNQASEVAEAKKVRLKSFDSVDDFKSYVDDGKRAYGGGVFEAEVLKTESEKAALSAAAAKSQPKVAAKIKKDNLPVPVNVADAKRFFSLGTNRLDGKSDIMQTGEINLFYSPENQFYWPSTSDPLLSSKSQDVSEGRTLIISAQPAESMAEVGSLAGSGDLLLSSDKILIFKNNVLASYGSGNATTSAELWRARINDGSRIIESKAIAGKLYLALETKIDAAHPCPIKPMLLKDEPLLIDCKDIYRPEDSILANAIYSVLELSLESGDLIKDVSFVGNSDNSTILMSDSSIYALWGQGGDYVALFTGFLKDKCRGLLPNYLLEKLSGLPNYDISLSAKEIELRALMSNWIDTFSPEEQTRIVNEITARLTDYLSGNYRGFERTGIAIADMKNFKILSETSVSGRLIDKTFISENDGELRVATVNGYGANKKINWLVTGKVGADAPEKETNDIYVFDRKLSLIGSFESLDLPAGICALSYSANKAFVSVCRPDGVFYAISLNARDGIGARGELKPVSSFAYLYSLSEGLALSVSKNDRKVQLAIFDVSLVTKPELRSVYDLNDYWADFDGNYQAFAADSQNKTFFLPASKGGYVFSYFGARLELKKAVGGFTASRSFMSEDHLYLVDDDKVEVFGGPDWGSIKSISF